MKKLNNENNDKNANVIYNFILKLLIFIRYNILLIYKLSIM